MIVYIASFPRSGNSLTRDIIHQRFGYPTTNAHPMADVPSYPERYPLAARWRQGRAITLWDKRRFWLVWNRWIALYDRLAEPQIRNARFLLRGCLPALTPGNRRRLAAEANVFFVKTHERPYERYFPGEFVIQPARHPGAVFRSYFNLLNKGQSPEISLDEFIVGIRPFGSYSDYHREWTTALEDLGPRGLRLHFEAMTADTAAATRQMAACIGLPADPDAPLRDFAGRASHNPHMFGFGSNAGWEAFYTEAQLRTLWALHGAVMAEFGYAEPDYAAAKDRAGDAEGSAAR